MILAAGAPILLPKIEREIHRPPTSMDDRERASISRLISTYGLAVFQGCPHQRDDGVVVTYTCGLAVRGRPELVVAGTNENFAIPIADRFAHPLLNCLSMMFPDDLPPEEDAVCIDDMIDGHPIIIRRLPMADANAALIHKTRLYHRRDVDVWQVTLPDQAGKFPWDASYDPAALQAQNMLVDWREIGAPK